MLKFKIDENLPVEVAELLTADGHDALTVVNQQLGGHADPDVAAVCRQEHRAILTLDLDFADIRTYPPATHSGIIVLRLTRLDKASVLSALQRILPMFGHEPLVGKLWIVDENRLRIRS